MLCQLGFQPMKITKRKGLARLLSLVLMVVGITGCSSNSFKTIVEHQLGVEYQTIQTTRFSLSSVARLKQEGTLRVYLGGDGKPWKKGKPSSNPSGTERLALELFLRDPKATHYISRPCYDFEPIPSDCQPKLWTSHRYSDEVIRTLTEALMTIAGNDNIELVGYSGGGTLAVLLAQQLPQVTRVLTISANLDHSAWTNLHQKPSLRGSENPAANALHTRGQELHLFGQKDIEVPAAINQQYFDNNPTAKIGVIDHFDHHCCWREQWPDILEAWESGTQ